MGPFSLSSLSLCNADSELDGYNPYRVAVDASNGDDAYAIASQLLVVCKDSGTTIVHEICARQYPVDPEPLVHEGVVFRQNHDFEPAVGEINRSQVLSRGRRRGGKPDHAIIHS